jgi:hypothetical protein
MRKTPSKSSQESIRDEYDFSQGVPGKYARRYAQGTNVVVLEPDVAKVLELESGERLTSKNHS